MKQPSRNPQSGSPLSNLISQANDLMSKGDYKKAILAWEDVIAIGSSQMNNGVWARLASAHRKLHDYNAVFDIARRAKGANQPSTGLYAEVATTLAAAGQEDDAIEYLVDAAGSVDDPKERLKLLNRVKVIKAGRSNIKKAKTVKQVMIEHQGRPFGKGEHYMDVYERYFQKFRNKPVNMLEIGVRDGGSLEVWKKYFGEQANIFGLDITPECKNFEEDRVKIFLGDQADKEFMNSMAKKMPTLDIVLDDGGHTMEQQINTFEVLYPKLAWGGVYICEDCGTSYLPNYGGGLKKEGTFIEYMKEMTDKLNLTLLGDVENNPIGTSTFGIHFYNSMVVLEKRRIKKHREVAGGKNRGLKKALESKPIFWV